MRNLIIASLFLVLAACANTEVTSEPAGPKVVHDQFTGSTTVSLLSEDVTTLGGETPGYIRLAGNQNTVVVETFYIMREWVFFDAVYADGRSYEIVNMDRQVNRSGGVEESFQIVMPNDEYQTLRSEGKTLSARGRRGRSDFVVPAGMFEEFFATYDGVDW